MKPYLLEDNSTFNRKAVEFAATLVPRDPHWEFFLWDGLEYSVAHYIYKKAFKPMYTNRPIKPIVSMNDFMKDVHYEHLPAENQQALNDTFPEFRKPGAVCSKQALEKAMHIIRDDYVAFINRRQ